MFLFKLEPHQTTVLHNPSYDTTCYAKTRIGTNRFSGYNTGTTSTNYKTATNNQEPAHQEKSEKLKIKSTKHATNQPQ
jgi:hypothetical protein